MGRKFPSLKEQNGDATIFLAMILALGVGTAVYYNMDKLNQQLKVNKVMTQKERAETRNLSGLSQAMALMSYSKANPEADDATAFPYIYPDPYLPGAVVGAPRISPNADTWSFAGMKLTVNSPVEGNMQADQFAQYIFQDSNNKRPTLSNKSTVQFLQPIYAANPNNKLIEGYTVSVTTSSFDAQNLVSKTTIKVPKPAKPKCTLTSLDGNKYQPNAPMHMTMTISGVALVARVPETTAAMVALSGDEKKHKRYDVSALQNSIRRINSNSFSWTVPAPRPLMAVDGDKDVQFEAFAYLMPVDNESETAVSCSFAYTVTPPATCKLWTDKATVSPGQCVNITSGTVGPVKANSLVLEAINSNDQKVAGLTQTGSTGKFCTPAVSSFATGVSVPKVTSDLLSGALSGFSNAQQKALYNILSSLQSDLNKLFKQEPELLNLSMGQFNELWDIGPTQLADLSTMDFTGFTYLSTLTTDQQTVFRTLKANDFNQLNSMTRINLSANAQLGTLSATTLKDLMSYDSTLLQSYLGSALDSAAAAAATPADYRVTGTVTATDGKSTSSCLVHVTAGTNKCDLYGSSFPNKSRRETVVVNYYGQMSSFSFDFYPSKPNWEVEGVASSPTQVDKCPDTARCYAVDNGSNRTPFVIVYNADANNCNAVASQRVDLGCFAADTKIRMGDGTDKVISDLQEGDKVYNPLRKTAVAIKRVTPGPERIPLWTVQTAEGTVQVTSKHPFLTADGLKQTIELKAGDRILGSQGEQVIQSISENKEAPKDNVWNFVLDGASNEAADHAILADGVVTGDLYLQEQLAREKNKALTQIKP